MATPIVYRVPRRFITFPDDPPPYGFLAISFLAHMACFGAAVALSAFISSRTDESKVYIVNLSGRGDKDTDIYRENLPELDAADSNSKTV